jgi:hypothetical protein
MTMLAQKKLSAAAAEIKPIVGNLRMFNSFLLLLIIGLGRRVAVEG